MTDVKLVRDLHITNVDQLHAYLGQHEFHANKVLLMHERNSDLLALVATHQMTQSPYQNHQHLFQSLYHNVYSSSSSIPQLEYAPTVNQQSEFSQLDSGESGSNSGKQRTVICYNCKGEGHMSKQCMKPKRKRDDSDSNPGLPVKVKPQLTLSFTNIKQAYQANDLMHMNSDYALAEVAVQKSNSSAQQDTLILSVIEQLKTQVVNCTKINLDNKSVNDTLTAELERYKE
ncbi:retrovirus-related pol polyprotein from transposon TNT 1-94, partial [Tanacetum coccineum]